MLQVIGKHTRAHTHTRITLLKNRLTDGLGDDDLWPLAVVRLGLNPSDGFPASTTSKLVDFLGQKYDPNLFSSQIKYTSPSPD